MEMSTHQFLKFRLYAQAPAISSSIYFSSAKLTFWLVAAIWIVSFSFYSRPVEMKKILGGLRIMKYCWPPWLADEKNFAFQIA